MKSLFMSLSITLLASASIMTVAHAEEKTLKEKTVEVGRDTKRGVKNTVREVKDKTCELVNGKMECAAQKVKHSAQRVGDKIEDAVE